jgi:LysM repeat protein
VGESAFDLARRFGVSVAGLLSANPDAADPVPKGTRLVVPDETASAGPPPPQAERTYTVARGDTLGAIARRHGTSVAEILRLNPAVVDPDRIDVGQVLRLPAAAPAAAVRPAPPPSRAGQAPAPRAATTPVPQPGWWERLTQGWDAWWDRLFSPPAASSPAKAAADGSLVLGVNDTYRDALRLASQRTGIDAAALAALVNAEAGRVHGAKLQQLTDDAFYARHPELNRRPLEKTDTVLVKEWKELHESMKQAWDPTAVNAQSKATGLTQFLKGTWLDQARRPGTYLNQVAREKGYVDDKNRLVAGMADELLALRTDPTLSIVAAAEYGKANLAVLDAKGLVPAGATDDEKARLMYLAHHEGSAGAVAVLNGTLGDERAKLLLSQNVGEKTREALVKEHGSEAKAYIAWLNAYIDAHIQPERFRKAGGK